MPMLDIYSMQSIAYKDNINIGRLAERIKYLIIRYIYRQK